MKQIHKLKKESIKNIKLALPNVIVISILIVVIRVFGLSFWLAMGIFFLYSLFAQVVLAKERNFKTIFKGFMKFGIFATIIWVLIKLLGGWGILGSLGIILMFGAYLLWKRRKMIDEGTDMIVATIKEALNENKKNKNRSKRPGKKRIK